MTVRVGFLGAGFIARYHAAMLGGRPDATIATVFDPDVERAQRFAGDQHAAVASTVDGLLAASDAVYVATWTAAHRALVGAVADAGLPVFCEKPLATSLADAVDMVQDVERAGVTNQVGLVLRDSPAFLLLRHLVQQPESGALMAIVFRDDQFLPIQGMYASDWRADPAKAGAGTLLEHSIHDLDLLEWIGGPVVEVSARTRRFHGIEGIEDLAVATLGFEGGGIATLTSVWHDVLARPSMRRVEVFCERAWYALEGDVFGPVRWTCEGFAPFGAAQGALEGSPLTDALAELGLRARNPDHAFIEAVIAGGPASPSMADALRPHVLAEAAYRSASERGGGGLPVAVPAGSPGLDWV